MSHLQLLLNQFISVIVDYHFEQTKEPYPTEPLLTQSHDELLQNLNNLISSATPPSQDSRKSFLEYVCAIIREWKRPLDQPEMLNEESCAQLQATLLQYFQTCRILFKLSHYSTHTLQYGVQPIQLYGFNNGVVQDSLARIGQIVQHRFFDYLELSMLPNPNSNGLNIIIETLISDHQRTRETPIFKSQIATYVEANEMLHAELQNSKNTEKKLAREIQILHQQDEEVSVQDTLVQLTHHFAEKARDLFFSTPGFISHSNPLNQNPIRNSTRPKNSAQDEIPEEDIAIFFETT